MSEIVLSAIGINHKTSMVAEREKFQIARRQIPGAIDILREMPQIEGALILATCNRCEFYLVHRNNASAFDIITEFYKKERGIDAGGFAHAFKTYKNEDATRHLFRVIAGLESLVIGEYQIQGQIKEAYSMACEHQSVDKVLHKLFHAAFRAGKKVRSKTSLGGGKQSVSGVASQILIDKLDPEDKVTVIGVNENTKILTEALSAKGFRNFIFANRTLSKAEIMRETYGGKATGLDRLMNNLYESRAVFSSTGSPEYVVANKQLIELEAQGLCPEIIIDMAIPRDIDTSGLPDSIEVYDLGSLREYLDHEREELATEVPIAEEIIESEVDLFRAWSESSPNDLLQPYAEKFEEIRQQLMEEFRDQYSEPAFERTDKLSRQLVHRMKSTFVRILVKQQQNGK
ncbi:MAG: glutamyl-tRNA reductase [Bacteroidota bacterium]